MGDEGELGEVAEAKEEEKKIVHTYPLIKCSDMQEDMKYEAMEISQTACEKYANNYEHAAKMVKEMMDKKFGPPFSCVVGEGFGFEITHEVNNLMFMFFGGNVAILCWKL